VTKTWKINRAIAKAKVEGTSPPADIDNYGLFLRASTRTITCFANDLRSVSKFR